MKQLIALTFGVFLIATASKADDSFLESIPEVVDTSKQYLFYLHGAIVERGDLSPTHPKFGLYDMPAIRQALVSEGTILISDHRAQGTKPMAYAQDVAKDIETLIAAGVPAQNITVSGFSKGGMITILTSSILKNSQVNFVFMASCNRWSFDNDAIKVVGRILSLYETSDTIGLSCAPLIAKSPDARDYKQIPLNTGKQHGAFYTPIDAWVQPLKAWPKSVAAEAGVAPDD